MKAYISLPQQKKENPEGSVISEPHRDLMSAVKKMNCQLLSLPYFKKVSAVGSAVIPQSAHIPLSAVFS